MDCHCTVNLKLSLPMRVRVKICGMTHPEDVAWAVAAGADALGFVFVPGTPRCLSIQAAADLARTIPPFVSGVGLFVNAPKETVEETICATGLRTVQFHGEETPEYCAQFLSRVSVIKAFRIRDRHSIDELSAYTQSTHAWLLDAYTPGAHGGTGQQFDWSVADALQRLPKPIIIAGGLNSQNVGDAIHRFHPYAVDVSSGVESAPGRKDSARVSAFLNAVQVAHFPPFPSPAMA